MASGFIGMVREKSRKKNYGNQENGYRLHS
jgi:hypothetical protein